MTKHYIPGYKSVREFAEQHGLTYGTASCHMVRGYCGWPRQTKAPRGTPVKQNRHPLYATWNNMKARCYYPKHKDYPNYGGRGITVCLQWFGSFRTFLRDMGDKPGPEYSLDRIDNNGYYTPANCRWATWKEQANNKNR